MRIAKISPSEWRVLSENAHKIAFDERKPAEWDRIAFALMAIDEKTDTPMQYVTCQELDIGTVYLQYGGSFPGTKDTIHSLTAFQGFLTYLKGHYDRVFLKVKNSNFPMLKLAMKTGFLIVGVRMFDHSIFLEHLLEFERN